jgi:heat shock protein HslJ
VPVDPVHWSPRAPLREPGGPRDRLAAVPTARSRTGIIGVLGTLALFAAIAGCSVVPGAPAVNIAEHDYLSTGITENGAPRALVAGTRVQLTFGAGNLNATAGCNHLGGAYRIEGGRLIFESAGMTAMGCDAPLHDQDAWLMTFLASKPEIGLAGSELRLDGGGVLMRLQDREVAVPDLDLVGPTWTLDSIVTGDAVSSTPAGVTATLVFHADGTVDVAPGCNHGSADWSAVESGISIGPIALTKMACQGPAGQVETAVLDVLRAADAALDGALAATIEGNALTLQLGGRGLVFRAT